jgi:Protein of unknown function (DUF1360)
MTSLSEIKSRLAGAAKAQGDRYSSGEDRPLAGYLGTMAIYGSLVGGLAGAAVATGRPIPDGLDPADVLLCAAATHKLSRLLAKDPVTSPLRAPFTSYQGQAGPSELAEEVRGHGARKTVGELITCPFCTGVWVATGLTAGLIFLPRTTRIAAGTLTALAGADLLQFLHAWLEKTAS